VIVPVDVADAAAVEEPPFAIHVSQPVIRPSDPELDEIAALLAEGDNITIYAGSGCADAHDELVQFAARLKAPIAHTSRGKDAIEYDNPYNVGMTGVIGMESGYQAVLNCDTLVLLAPISHGASFIQTCQDHPSRHRSDPSWSTASCHARGRRKHQGHAPGSLAAYQQREDSSFLDSYVERHHKALAAQAGRATPGRHGKIYGQYLTSIIDRLADQDALFAADDGHPRCGASE